MNPTHYALLREVAVAWCRGRIGKSFHFSSQSTTRTCNKTQHYDFASHLLTLPTSYADITELRSPLWSVVVALG